MKCLFLPAMSSLALITLQLEIAASFQVPLLPHGVVVVVTQQRKIVRQRLSATNRLLSSRSVSSSTLLLANKKDEQEYRNAATKVLSNFMAKDDATDESSRPLAGIDFDARKLTNLPLETLAQALDAELYASEWFVTGLVNPVYFSDTFTFQDPDVKLTGIQEYAVGVNKLFDQKTARAEIISTVVNSSKENTISCTWRLSGKVDIGPGLTIKPYIVFTDFTVDAASGLIVFQEDRFDLPQWDILLSALFPFLIGKVTSQPAPAPEPRDPPPSMPKLLTSSQRESPFGALQVLFGGLNKKRE